MAPITETNPTALIEQYVKENKVVVFSKSFCPFCHKVKNLFTTLNIPFFAVELDERADGAAVQDALHAKSGQRTVPNVFISGQHLGGCDATMQAHTEGKLLPMINESPKSYDYDLIVIGGGSGGLAASKEAANLGKKVAVCDFVKPSPMGTTWGLGGTCVNVGCIPKKLMHQASLLGQAVKDATFFGWEVQENVNHNWNTMVENIQNHIGSLNWNYRISLREKKVTYMNHYAEFVDPHTLKTRDRKGVERTVTAEHFILATGGRPRYPDIPGAKEFGITSDDLFSLSYHPGKTLLVGASYISLECAGFLAGIGVDCTVMVRSILLRGFDQQMAELIGAHMENSGIRFIRQCVPLKVEQLESGKPGKLKVTGQKSDGEVIEEEFNTVIFAIGRDACTGELGLDKAGIEVNKKNGKIMTNEHEQTNVSHVYAVGDILDGRQELTPVAIQVGKLLSQRLYNASTTLMDYVNVPTTVFTPLEYGVVGLSEEAAVQKYGENEVEVYHTYYHPLECTLPKRDENACYAKLLCVKPENGKVVGFHVLGPNAGEITQGFALGIRLGATKADFDSLVGIHPTTAEVFTTLEVSKSSGANIRQQGC